MVPEGSGYSYLLVSKLTIRVFDIYQMHKHQICNGIIFWHDNSPPRGLLLQITVKREKEHEAASSCLMASLGKTDIGLAGD